MRNFHLPTALLPDGWASDVLLSCDGAGRILLVAPGTPCPPEADRLAGAAIPGMPNLHSHAHQRAIAGLTERAGPGLGQAGEDSFWTWRDAMYRLVAHLDPDAFQAVATQLYVEMLRAGYTHVAEFHYLHHAPDGRPYADPAELSHRCIAAAAAAGIGLTLLPVLYCASGFGGAPPTEAQRRFAHTPDGFLSLLQRLPPPGPMLGFGVAPHSLRAVPPDALAALLAAAPDGPVHIHVAEQPAEVRDCLAHTGQRPVAWLLDHAPVDARWCIVHATHMDPAETAALAATGAIAGLCPTTEANLGDGIPPAAAFQAAGGRFGIGSDSHVSVSPFEELRWLEYAQRLVLKRRTVLAGGHGRSTGRTLWDAAARAGATACGYAGGMIAPGARADLVMLDTDHPLLAARHGDTLLDSATFSGNANLVRHVVAGGACVVRDGRHPLQDAAAARFKAAVATLAD